MKRPRTHRAWVAVDCARGLGALAALMLAGCLVDKNDKCGANQTDSEVPHVEGCVCVANSVLNADGVGCTLCREHEEVSSDGSACVCSSGFARETAGGPCVQSQLGAACSASTPCSGTYPLCTSAGYCTTSGCTSSQQCQGGYTCDTAASPSYCRKPASGQATSCTSSENCASFDAKFCALGGATGGACAVSGCKTVKARCDVGYSCCDLTNLGLADICVSDTQLSGGKCPGIPGMLSDPVVVP